MTGKIRAELPVFCLRCGWSALRSADVAELLPCPSCRGCPVGPVVVQPFNTW